jgi:hypothetical protein
MPLEKFAKSVVVIASVFPDRKIETEVFYELLKDLDGDKVFKAVIDICKTETQLYPGSNLIAMIREIADPSARFIKREHGRR